MLNPFRKRNREHRTKPSGSTGYQAEHWFPAELRPDECLWDKNFRCIRDDHQHDGDDNE
jgi:hypothetical protein